MSEAKHTPGPWSVSDKNASGNVSEDYLFIEPGIAVIERKVAGQNECDMPDACLIASAPELLEALQWREQFEVRQGEDANDRFERIGSVFRRETGYLRPGADCVLEPYEIRQAAWDEWMAAGIARSRAAIAKATATP